MYVPEPNKKVLNYIFSSVCLTPNVAIQLSETVYVHCRPYFSFNFQFNDRGCHPMVASHRVSFRFQLETASIEARTENYHDKIPLIELL